MILRKTLRRKIDKEKKNVIVYILAGSLSEREGERERERERDNMRKEPSDYFSGIDTFARLFIVSRFPPIQIILGLAELN